MNRLKAEKRIRRKATKIKPCPFCGKTPKIEATCETAHSDRGSWGHFAYRHGCCPATDAGQTKLFFCNDWKRPDFGLWWNMFNRLVDDWNRRQPQHKTGDQ